MDQTEMVVAVIVASVGRPEVLADVVADLDAQTYPVRHRVLSVPDETSLPEGGPPDGWLVVNDSGLAAQRNAGVRAVPDVDVIFFFDDDAVVRADYVERAIALFARRPNVVGLTGHVLLDGAAGIGDRTRGRPERDQGLRRIAGPAGRNACPGALRLQLRLPGFRCARGALRRPFASLFVAGGPRFRPPPGPARRSRPGRRLRHRPSRRQVRRSYGSYSVRLLAGDEPRLFRSYG